jgi:hypothetical protein
MASSATMGVGAVCYLAGSSRATWHQGLTAILWWANAAFRLRTAVLIQSWHALIKSRSLKREWSSPLRPTLNWPGLQAIEFIARVASLGVRLPSRAPARSLSAGGQASGESTFFH